MYNNFVNPYYPQSLVDIGQVNSEQEAVNAYVAGGIISTAINSSRRSG